MMKILGSSSVVRCLNKLTSSNIAHSLMHETEKDQLSETNRITLFKVLKNLWKYCKSMYFIYRVPERNKNKRFYRKFVS